MTAASPRESSPVTPGPGAPRVGGATVLSPREVPLGGLRAMTVRRTLPQRVRSTIGAFCFVDHYGPDNVARTGGMKLPPHPHTGLQTVTWLFSGEVEHRDSLGTRITVRPGELNLMTAGRGISHSEDSTATTTILHGAQLWTVLPARFMGMTPQFEHYAPEPVDLPGARIRVFLGGLAGAVSPVRVFSPLVGAEVSMPPGGEVELDLASSFEHGYLLDEGAIAIDGRRPQRGELLYVPPGRRTVHLRAGASGGRLLLLGGTPFTEEIVMWWNFIGRTHEEVVEARAQWQREIGADDDGGDREGVDGGGAEVGAGIEVGAVPGVGDLAGGSGASDEAAGDADRDALSADGAEDDPDAPAPEARFGLPHGYPGGGPLPAPVLPRNTILKPRVTPMPPLD